MSRPTPISSYQPDPNGWINTATSSSSSSSARKSSQRPLIAFNHGIATPLSSGFKKSLSNVNNGVGGGPGPTSSLNMRKRLYENDKTPTSSTLNKQSKDSKQGNLNGFLQNTPSSNHGPKFNNRSKLGKKDNNDVNNESRIPLHDRSASSPIPPLTKNGLIFGGGNGNKKKDTITKGSKLKIYQDDFWGSGSENDESEGEEEDLSNKKMARTMKTTLSSNTSQRKKEKEKEQKDSSVAVGHSNKKRERLRVSSISPIKRKISDIQEVSPQKLSQRLKTPPISLPPPAHSTRSHDKLPTTTTTQQLTVPSALTNTINRKSSYSPSLPPLTPSSSLETEATQPREPSLSPGPYDRLPINNQSHQTPLPPPNRQKGNTPKDSSSSPPPPITPVPEYILHNHKQICGRNPSQLAAIPSPWRKRTKPQLKPDEQDHNDGGEPVGDLIGSQSKKRKVNSREGDMSKRKDDIDRRVWNKGHQERHKTPPPSSPNVTSCIIRREKQKNLVELSSSSNPSSDPVPPEDQHNDNNENNFIDDLPTSDPSIIETPSKKKDIASPKSIRKALTPIKSNLLSRCTISSSNIGRNRKSPKKSPLTTPRRRKIGTQVVVSPLPRTSIMQRDRSSQREMELERERSISPSPVKASSKAFPRLSGSPLSSPTKFENRQHPTKSPKPLHHDHQSIPRTPEKASPKKHYQITPPKSSNKRPKLSERQETLFVLPDPPIQPNFSSSLPRSKDTGPREWKVAEMEPETLLDWGLESDDNDDQAVEGHEDGEFIDRQPYPDEIHDGPLEMPSPELAPERTGRRQSSQFPEPPLFSPHESPLQAPEERPSLENKWSSKSIEPTALSQDFPRLISSSPSLGKKESPISSSSPPRPAPADIAQDNEQNKANPAHTTPRASSSVTGKSKWDHLQRGILSTHTPTSSTSSGAVKGKEGRHTPPTSQKGSKRKARSSSDQNEQSKLASFGFFNDKPNKKLKRDFENKWEDEDDLQIPEDEDGDRDERNCILSNRITQDNQGNKKLGKVPNAPYHPSLRPAGIRELERRTRLDDKSVSEEGMKKSNFKTPPLNRKSLALPKINGDNAAEEVEVEEEESPSLFDNNNNYNSKNDSHSSSSQSDLSSSTFQTPGSTKEWWDKLGDRRTSEFGTME
ncbi:uncharacterized protein L201_004047 [Kwoniella dendrophila CBS 6074]|uniref:Uncharacterized protein n=1 Tax=Kwoniella dendrophila CBS 6074 TaxID=1295534 RepID=A0AAX4JUS4_9TREE